MENINSLKNLSQKELTEILKQPEDSLVTSILTEEDKTEIGIGLCKMVLLRSEDIEDYNFELWMEYFIDQGYTKLDIFDIIECGKRMRKFGNYKLAIGDLISEWENSMDSYKLSYYEAKRELRTEKKHKIKNKNKET